MASISLQFVGICNTRLEFETQMLIRDVVLKLEKEVSKDIGQRPNVLQTLQTDRDYLMQGLALFYERPCEGNFERSSRWFYGIGDLLGELYELMYNMLLQFKFKGAQEDQLRYTLQLDLRRMNESIGNTLAIQDLETFRMTDSGRPLRYCAI